MSVFSTVLADDAPVSYYVPPNQFYAAMQVMDMGFANDIALFRVATASFTYSDTDKSIGSLRIAVDTTSLLANNNENQRDLANLLGSFQFPEIRMTAPDMVKFTDNKAEIKANVTFHGITKPVTFTATLNHVGKSDRAGSMWSSEGDAVGISIQGSLKRADFGLTDNPDAPPRYGDSITLQLEMQAMRQ